MIKRYFAKALKQKPTVLNFQKLRANQIEEAFKQYLTSNSLSENKFKDFIETKQNPTFSNLSSYFSNVKSKLDILYNVKCIEEISHNVEFSINQLALDFLSKKIIERQFEFDIFDMIKINDAMARLCFKNNQLLQLLEERILDDKVLIYRQKEKAINTIKTIINIFMIADSPRPELFFELARGIKVMHRENVISDRKLLESIKFMLKAGNCHGLSGIVEQRIDTKKKSFKELVQIVELAVPLRLFTKEKIIQMEEHLLDYMRLYLNENYSYDLLLKESFDHDLKVESGDILRLFSAFADSGFFSDKLRDRLLIYIEKNIEGLKNSDFLKVVDSFSKGKYNYNNYQTLYKKIEFETSTRLNTIKLSAAVKLFHSLLSYGKLSVKLLQEFSNHFASSEIENVSLTHVNILLEAIVLTETYLLPEEFIEEPFWKDNVNNIKGSLTDVYYRIFNNKLILYFKNYKVQSFNIFLSVRTLELVSDVSQILNIELNFNDLIDLHELLFYYNKDYHTYISNYRKLLPMERLSIDIDNYSDHIKIKHSKFLHPDDITRILYKLVCSNTIDINVPTLISFLDTQYEKITKDHFVKLIHIAVTYNKLDSTLKLFKVIKDLHSYGDIRYFFKIEDYVTLAYNFLLYYLKKYEHISNKAANQNMTLIDVSKKTEYYLSNSDKENIKTGLSNFLNCPKDDLLVHLLNLNPNKLNYSIFEQYKTLILTLYITNDLVS